MRNKIRAFSSEHQTDKINKILGINKTRYVLSDIFEYLPDKITYNGMTGYLRLSNIDIVYSSLESEQQGRVVAIFQYMIGEKNVYDGFIDALKWMKEHDF